MQVDLVYYCDRNRHLICVPYSVDNLHTMADHLGIKRCWFHRNPYPHYDIPKKMVVSVSERCRIVDSKSLLRMIKQHV